MFFLSQAMAASGQKQPQLRTAAAVVKACGIDGNDLRCAAQKSKDEVIQMFRDALDDAPGVAVAPPTYRLPNMVARMIVQKFLRGTHTPLHVPSVADAESP